VSARRGIQPIMPRIIQGGLAALLLAGVPGCAAKRPEQALRAVAEDGVTRVELDSLTVNYEVNGLPVIQRSVYSSDVVAVQLYLLGGVRQLTPATQGMETMLLETTEHGSAAYPKAAMRSAVGRTGSSIGYSAEVDWTVYEFHGLRQAFDSTWAVFADRLLHPTLAPADVELVRTRLVRSAARRRMSPASHVYYLADSLAFAGHPYALHPAGTEASLAGITPAMLRRYHEEQLVTSRMLLVVVGNVPRATVEAAVRSSLGQLPRGEYRWALPDPVPPSAARGAVLEQRAVNTNYLLGLFDGPAATSEDHAAFEVALAILSSRLFGAIREDKSLSYSASAPFMNRGLTGGGMYVSTHRPKDAVPIMREQLRRLRAEPLDAYALRRFVEGWTLEYFYDHATSEAQAAHLARFQLLHGDWRAGVQRMQALRAVRSSDVRTAAARYMKDIRFAYVGDTTRVDRRELGKF